MSGRYVPQVTDKPLCPNSFTGTDLAHRAAVMVEDAWYESVPKDDEGEVLPAFSKIGSGRGGKEGMDLYCIEAVTAGHPARHVEAWYFRCPVCGLILPATNASRVGA